MYKARSFGLCSRVKGLEYSVAQFISLSFDFRSYHFISFLVISFNSFISFINCIHLYIHTYIHTYKQTYTRTYIHTTYGRTDGRKKQKDRQTESGWPRVLDTIIGKRRLSGKELRNILGSSTYFGSLGFLISGLLVEVFRLFTGPPPPTDPKSQRILNNPQPAILLATLVPYANSRLLG